MTRVIDLLGYVVGMAFALIALAYVTNFIAFFIM